MRNERLNELFVILDNDGTSVNVNMLNVKVRVHKLLHASLQSEADYMYMWHRPQ